MNFFSLICICSTFIIRIFLRFKRNFGSPNPTTNFETTNPDFSQISYPILFFMTEKIITNKQTFGQIFWWKFGFVVSELVFTSGHIMCNFLVFIFHLPDLKIILNFHFFYKINLYYFLYGFFGHEKKKHTWYFVQQKRCCYCNKTLRDRGAAWLERIRHSTWSTQWGQTIFEIVFEL